MHDCLIDGEISSEIPVSDRAFLYGHGIFETIAVESAQPVFWQQHLLRLREGCQRLGLCMPDEIVLLRELQTVCAGKLLSVVRISISASGGARGYSAYTPSGPTATRRTVSCHAWPADVELPRLKGIELPIAEYQLAHNRRLAAIKHSNRLEQVIAASEPAVSKAGEGLMLDQDEFVISTVSANIFLVNGGQLITPRMDRCGIHGVTRGAILQAFSHRCEKRRVTLQLLSEAEEVFLCNSIRGIWPITRIADWQFEIGPFTREIQAWLGQQSKLLAKPA
ncbi:MAG: aminodeoxychorismate lyase [Xanthomonadales bacterium]|nr:aminodeoxychorismate lyase [Xanthomonadales bacterium]